jgi:type VI secretion system protein ImpA
MAAAVEAVSSPVGPVIDIPALLAPIAGDNPAGKNLQYSELHDEIREARRAEDNLEQGQWKRETKAAEWHKVAALAGEALASRSKDLQIGAWLNEALVKIHGFAGLRDGLKLIRGLHERYWESLYPEIDEGDLEARANSLTWMDRQVGLAVKEVPVTESLTGANYSFLQWQDTKNYDIPEKTDDLDSDDLDRISHLKSQAEEEGKITSEQWRGARNATRRAFYEQTHALLGECWAEFVALDQLIDAKYERQSPGLSALKKSLDEVRSLIDKTVKEKRLLEPDPAGVGAPAPARSDAAPTGPAQGGFAVAVRGGPIRSRQEALAWLVEAASYFRRTEPHSPVSYLVQRAVKWGQMPLESWLQDVIKNDGVLDELRETLGLNKVSESHSSPDDRDA